MSAPLVDIAGLEFSYPGVAAPALAGLDLRVAEGEAVALVGPNGSGKSTLARLLAGLATADAAVRASVCGHDLLDPQGRLDARRDVGVLFQDPENQLVAENVEEDVAFGLENLGWPAERIRERVEEMLVSFGLETLRERAPHLLSGGQKQRTALAGVLAIPRRVLVLDEPTAMLDPGGRDEVLAAVRRVRAEGLATVYVTQEMDEVGLADRVVALERGAAVFEGTPRELFADMALVSRLQLGLPPAAEVALALGAVAAGERAAAGAAAGEAAGEGREPAATRALPLTLDELLTALSGSAT
jgi:energy-coupling factor transport system ATP-binding protein